MSLPPLWSHQADELRHNRDRSRLALHWSPRLGKTRVATDDLAYAAPDRALVTAPLAVCPDWADILAATGFSVIPAYKFPIAELRELRGLKTGVVVLNDDKLRPGVEDLLKWAPQACVFDESHRFKSPSSGRGRAFRRLAWQAARVRNLTGTPAPNHYGDLWGQMVGLDRDEWCRSYGEYAFRYLIRDPVFPSRVLGVRNQEQLQRLILRWASILRREDVFGPDQYQYVTRLVELPYKARRLYDKFAHEWEIEEPELSADNVLERLLRLRQIAAGFIGDHVAGTIEVLHEAIVDRLVADLSESMEAGEKAVVYHFFRWEGERAAVRLGSELHVPIYRINGDVPGDERQAITKLFNETPGARIAVVQIQSGGTGISFAQADQLCFLSASFSFSDMEQARDRVYAPGKRRVITSYRASETVHEFIGDVLDSKGSVHEALRNADRRAITHGYRKRRKAA